MAFASLCLLLGVEAQTTEIQSLTEIQEGVSQYLEQQLNETLKKGSYEVQVGKMDSRIRMPRCNEALVFFLPQGARRLGNVTVGVRCPGTAPWTLYVSAHIAHYRNVVVLARPLPRGAQLTRQDLRMRKRATTTLLSGYIADIDNAVGMRLKRSLPEGYVLVPRSLERRNLVRRGQQVTLLANGSGLEVRSTGKALSDGAKGEVIAVKNTSSGSIVEGIVSGDGLVQVGPR